MRNAAERTGTVWPLVPRPRSTAVDVCRGLALLAIAWDHVSLGWAQAFTLHTVAWCDAAEVFVFLGGYASASAFAWLQQRQGACAAWARFAHRSWEIYRAFLILAALMLAFGLVFCALGWTPSALDQDVAALLQNPGRVVLEVLLARRQPYLSAILPMYALFALSTPGLLWCRARAPGVLLAGTIAVWVAAPGLGAALPSVTVDGWAFNPLAWQALFVLGLLAQSWPAFWERCPAQSVRRRALTVVLTLGAVVALGLALDRLLWHTAAPPGVLKQNLALIRLGNLVALAAGTFLLLQWPPMARWTGRQVRLADLGRHSLACFMLGACVSLVLNTVLAQWPHHGLSIPWWARLGADALVPVTLLAWVAWREQRWPAWALRLAVRS